MLVACVRQLHFGVHDGSSSFQLESTAYNHADFRVADQRGWAPRKELIDPACAESQVCTALDLQRVAQQLAQYPAHDSAAPDQSDDARADGCWRVGVSTDPGRFVCNCQSH